MPIKFACQHCDQVLSVSSSKIGRRAKCPKCQQPITVPDAQQAAESIARRKTAAPPSNNEDLFSQFVVYDDSAELVYESEEPPGRSRAETQSIDRSKVAVARVILYIQGALLGVVALVCFALGVVAGRATSPGVSAISDEPQPCTITGTVAYTSSGGEEIPDAGAVVLIVPQNAKPDERAGVQGLGPNDPPPTASDRPVTALRSIGGDYTRADIDGRYRLHVPDRGEYFVLFLSRTAKREQNEPLDNMEMAELGRYVLPATDLIGTNRYRWMRERVKGDMVLDVAL
jgi:hypothetical protein